MMLGTREIPHGFKEILVTYIWPTSYWYVGGLILFEIIVYILEKLRVDRKKTYFMLVIAWILYYIFLIDKTSFNIEGIHLLTISGFYKCIYSLMLFYCGYIIGEYIHTFSRHKSSKYFLHFWVSFTICYILKYLIIRYSFFLKFQILVQFFNCIIAISILLWAVAYENTYSKVINKRVIEVINWISGKSLEIYMVQFAVITFAEKILLSRLHIPWYWVIICVLFLINLLAFGLKKITKYLLDILLKLGRTIYCCVNK